MKSEIQTYNILLIITMMERSLYILDILKLLADMFGQSLQKHDSFSVNSWYLYLNEYHATDVLERTLCEYTF